MPRQENFKSKPSLGHLARPCLRMKTTKGWRGRQHEQPGLMPRRCAFLPLPEASSLGMSGIQPPPASMTLSRGHQSWTPRNECLKGHRPHLRVEPQIPHVVILHVKHTDKYCANSPGLAPAITQLLKTLSHRGDGGGVAGECGAGGDIQPA